LFLLFLIRFDVVCLDSNANQVKSFENTKYGFDDDSFQFKILSNQVESKSFYLNELIEINNTAGKLHTTKSLNKAYIQNEFCNALINEIFTPFVCQLKFGHLESSVTLIPPPLPFKG
jgi:hypothetical protein